jgi:hypothetical protein
VTWNPIHPLQKYRREIVDAWRMKFSVHSERLKKKRFIDGVLSCLTQ